MWQQSPNLAAKSTFADAKADAATFDLAGYDDWRLPTIKELYSLIQFTGSSQTLTPYIDTDVFDFRFGDEGRGERVIDGQYWSSTEYLGLTMGGPSVRWFGFEDDHSPHYRYDEFSPDGVGAWRRSVYRHIVRSVPDPFFEALDCADPSALTPTRYTTLTPLQALALLNNGFMLRQAEHFAARVRVRGDDERAQVDAAFRLALGRAPTSGELSEAVDYARSHGLAGLCRLIFNLNEFVFVD